MSSVICTVDVVLLTLREGALCVALLKREREPFQGVLTLPGGYVHTQEDRDTEDAAARVLREKTGIVSPYLEQLGTFSGIGRDPRGWSLSVSYYALVAAEIIERAKPRHVEIRPADDVRGLPFDHPQILEAALARVRNKSSYSSLPVYLCKEVFTLPQLQSVYEAVLGEPINKVSFRRKMEELDILEPVAGALEKGRANRPAQLYRLRKSVGARLSMTDRGLNAG